MQTRLQVTEAKVDAKRKLQLKCVLMYKTLKGKLRITGVLTNSEVVNWLKPLVCEL